MRRLIVGTALLFASLAGGIAGAGLARADVPTTDDWNVRRTYASAMWINDGRPYVRQTGYAGCAVGYGYDSYADDYCAD